MIRESEIVQRDDQKGILSTANKFEEEKVQSEKNLNE